MKVVSNTSPLINLAAIGRFELLQKRFDHLLVPEAVHREIVRDGAGRAGAAEVQASAWIEQRALADRALVTALSRELDEGEAEAIALAAEVQADLLLMDERRGRRLARQLGLRPLGLLGLLLEAKHHGHLERVRPAMDELIAKAGFWIGQPLYDRVITAAQE